MHLGQDIGIDLGTTTVLVYLKKRGLVLKEPAVLLREKQSKKIIAIGEEANKMLGRTSNEVEILTPLQHGTISDSIATEKLLHHCMKHFNSKSMFTPRIVMGIPSNITEVERKALEEATKRIGAREVYLLSSSLMAAIGAGIDITAAKGKMIIDIGGGVTNIAIISLGGIVKAKSIKLAGSDFDEAIIKYLKKKYNMIIGEKTAERIKINIGGACKRPANENMKITGRDLINGVPVEICVSSDEIYKVLELPINNIIEEIRDLLSEISPELIEDIMNDGIYLTGGSSELYGMDKCIQEKLKMQVAKVEKPEECVVRGIGKTLENIELIEGGNTLKTKK